MGRKNSAQISEHSEEEEEVYFYFISSLLSNKKLNKKSNNFQPLKKKFMPLPSTAISLKREDLILNQETKSAKFSSNSEKDMLHF